MAGGFSGTRLTLDESDRETAKTEIQAKLKESIMIKANSERPDGFYLYNNASFIVFEDLPQTEDGESVTLRIKAVLYGIIFDEDDFAKFIASNTIAGFDGGDVMLLNPEVLSVNTSGETEDRPWEGDAISVDISGTTNIVWVFDEEGLKRDLAGKSKNALPTILSGYTSIQSIEASLWPFWKGSFPEEIDKIRIETNLDN
jgi:hypothetical protein